MAVTVYRSTDAGAPLLTNSNGSLIAVLKACLVDGYGSKPPAGWTAPFTGTNLIAFKEGVVGNNRYLRVYDGGTDSSGFRVANVRAYEAMTAVSTGTGPCPTLGQASGNGATLSYFQASRYTPNVSWIVVATPSFFHLIVEQGDDNSYPEYLAFGKFISDLAGDTFNEVLLAGSQPGAGWTGHSDSYTPGMWVMRSDTGALGAVSSSLLTDARAAANTTVSAHGAGSTFTPYPDRVRGGLLQSQAAIFCDGYRRGRVPGLWEQHHVPTAIGGHRTTWTGATGALAGKQFQLFGPLASLDVGYGAHVVLELSDTWS